MADKFKTDLTKMKFGLLTVIEYSHTRNRAPYWLCECRCGMRKAILGANLVSGKTQSCGCLQRKRTADSTRTHGKSKTRLYRIWKGMKRRCNNRNVKAYPQYGGRGIKICSEWNDFEAFEKWALENGYAENLTIERKDCDGIYEPDNCEWITLSDQGKNTSRIHYIEYEGETLSLAEWSAKLGGNPNLVTTRLQRGWSEEDAVTIPPKRK